MNIGAGIGIGFQELFSKAFRYDTTIACQNGSDVTPVIKLPGGTFSATPAGLSLNSTTGVIDVSASTVGTYTVTYSIGPTEDTITILPADDASFSYSSTSFRQNASNPAPTITGLVGGVFSGPTGIIFADSGTNTNSSSGIINLAASTVGGPYTITYTTTGNCPASRNFDVTIQVALSITYSATSFCEDGGNTAAPTVVGDPGSGTFASTTGLTINSTTGVINTDTSTPDENTPYTVTYTASTGETATTQVTIKNLPTIVITPNPSLSICDGSSATLTASGGASYLWSTGATSAQITVSSSGTYSVTGTGSNGCQNTASAAFTVNPLPTISITASSTSICAGDSVTLTASGAGAGGSYSWSDGQTTAAITVTPGATITYSVTGTDANGCFNTASQQITVTAVDTATVVYDSNSYCQVPTGALAVEGYYPLYTTESASNAESSDGTSHTHVLSGTTYYMPNAGIVMYHGTYSLTTTPTITGASGTFNNPTGLSINTTTGVIDKNASTPGTYSVVYTTSGSCSITVTNSITITALDNATATYSASSYCENGSNPTPSTSASGTFTSSNGLSINSGTGVINLSASTPGAYKIGFVTNGTCPNSSLQSMTILDADDATFSYSASSYCQNVSNPTPTISGTSGGTFSSTTGLSINSTTGEIDLAASTVGSYVVTYTTAGTCSASSTQNVAVAAADVVSLSYPASSYPQSGTDPSPTFSPSGGTFSATPAGLSIDSITGVIDLSASSVNSYTITYTSGGTCPSTATFNLSITSVSAAFNYSASAYCQDAADPTPTVTGTSGGTFSATLEVVPFQMQFEVASGAQKTISIPGVYGASFTIDWGDGFTETSTGSGNRVISHTYNDGNNTDVTNPTVSIGATGDSGPLTNFAFNNSGSASDLLDIPQWGNIAWGNSLNVMFSGCNNTSFQISATDSPDLSNTTIMAYMFYNATHFNSSIDHWDVSNITSMSGTFRGCDNFNQSLNSWDVSNVTNFSSMFFANGTGSFNGNISNWDMSSCQTTVNMIYKQPSFNQDISGWNFSSAWTNASYMFYNSSSFNQDLGSWNVSGVQNMSGMLRGCTNFNNNGGTLSGWNVSNVTTMNRMFQSSTSFVGTGLDSWNPSSCTDFGVMLYAASSFNQNLGSWSLNSSLTTAGSIFTSNTSLSQANYTDTLVGWANTVYTNSAPYNVDFTGNSFSTKFDGTRSGGANFTTAQDAYNYLVGATASWSIS